MRTTTLLVAAGLTAACATIQIPSERLEQPQAIIRSAEEIGAPGVPAARLHLQLAKDQIAAAQQLAERGDDRAYTVLARAQADANLALALAREDAQRRVTKEAEADLNRLKARGGTP